MRLPEKKYHKNERHLCLITHFFTKLSQIVFLITMHILMYRYAIYNCKLWKAFWFYCVFRRFSYIIDGHSCLKYCISTKLSQIVCLTNVHILVCQYAKCDCRLWRVLWFNCVFWEFSYITTCLKRYNFTKLLQIVC